jgi:hypothetical protein
MRRLMTTLIQFTKHVGILHFIPLDYRYAEQGLNKSKLRFRNGAFMPDPDPVLVWIKLN